MAREESDKVYYKNPNGNLTESEILKIIEEDKVMDYIRNFKLVEGSGYKCPPNAMRHRFGGYGCFKCKDCLLGVFDLFGYESEED